MGVECAPETTDTDLEADEGIAISEEKSENGERKSPRNDGGKTSFAEGNAAPDDADPLHAFEKLASKDTLSHVKYG